MKPVLLLTLLATPALAAPLASDVGRYQACLALVKSAPGRAVESAQAWRIENGGVPALHCLALAEFAQQDYAAALATFDKAVKGSVAAQDGKAVTILSQAADAAMLAGQPAAAVGFLDTAIAGPGGIALSPRAEASLRVTRAEALVDLKREKAAAVDLDTATKLDPAVPFGWLLKATLARRMGDFKTAEAAILKAAEQDPDSADIQYEAGNIAAAQGNDQLARTAWIAAARADPDSPAGKAANKAMLGD
jgi:tetratricopeptide (TPR) repeat protein